MRKKLMLFVVLSVLCLCCSSCGIVGQSALRAIKMSYELAYESTEENTSETKMSKQDEELAIYVEEQFAEKYGKEFEFLNIYSTSFMFSRDCNIKCVDDGIEFQASVHIKDYYEVESENYLLYKYFDDAQNDVIRYTNQYFDEHKLVTRDKTDRITKELPFDTSAELSYEELEALMSLDFYILIPEDTVFSEEEWAIMIEKFASSSEYVDDDEYVENDYREDINLKIYFSVYRVPNDVYQDLEFITTFDEFRKLKNNQNYEITRIL